MLKGAPREGCSDSEKPLDVSSLREELQAALDRQAECILERIRREIRPSSTRGMVTTVSNPFNTVDARCSWEEEDDTEVRVPQRVSVLPRKYQSQDDGTVKRSFRVYRRYEGSYPPRRSRMRSVHASYSQGPRISNRRSEASTYSDISEEPAGDILPMRARESVVSRATSEYFNNGYHGQMVTRGHWQYLSRVVNHPIFEYLTGLLVITNAVTLGIETNYQVTHRVEHIPKAFSVTEAAFCVLFTVEQLMRLQVHGRRFFTMKGWPWNIFDLVVVTLQLVEQVSHVLRWVNIHMNVSVIRTCRVLRLIRITRLIRVVRLVQELRMLVASILNSFKSLGWTLLLLAIVIYIFSVLFTQIVLDAIDADVPVAKDLERWFGSLPRTALTLFESILGGLSWEEPVSPLISVSPVAACLFCFYVAFCVFALMNVVTGVFVDKAMQSAQDHKDKYLANQISDLFFSAADNDSGDITWEMFQQRMGTPEMKEYFKAINVDPSEAYGLFQLLDTDDSGGVDCEEIVNGLLRLRGGARALELSLLMTETSHMHKSLNHHLLDFNQRLQSISRAVSKG